MSEYDYMLHTLPPGCDWNPRGIHGEECDCELVEDSDGWWWYDCLNQSFRPVDFLWPNPEFEESSMNHRQHVGPAHLWDLIGAHQFCVLIDHGLREDHRLLDVGCGSLRAGRLLIPYLAAGNYCGIEPHVDVLNAGIENEFSRELVNRKQCRFDHTADFDITDRLWPQFDYILAYSILSHTGLDMADLFWQRLAPALADDGLLLATMNVSTKDSAHRGWLYPGALTHTLETMQTLAAKAGLFLESLNRRSPSGQTWLLARKVV